MSDTVIKAENISKQYRLGTVSTGTLSHDLNRWWHTVRGKEDPYLMIGETNDRTQKGGSEYVWALRNINFEVKQGQVLGIIGRNGAGKSTLLKILSRTTAPTEGSIKIRGRIASLLEVGTGFHPDLSGRENIFLNGAILGMTKQEIKRKFDEIVDFGGVERYIDTPVKRYSSGMYVRLAFAVAAHLEPEILIVDEVLAVGDAEFQKKCLGKMKDVSEKDGRTVLVVSHILSNIKAICDKTLYLNNGTVQNYGDPEDIIKEYIQSANSQELIKNKVDYFDASIQIEKIIDFGSSIKFSVELNLQRSPEDPVFIDFAIANLYGDYVIHHKDDIEKEGLLLKPGRTTIDYIIQNPMILQGEYSFVLFIFDSKKNLLLWKEQTASFQIAASGLNTANLRSHFLADVSVIQNIERG